MKVSNLSNVSFKSVYIVEEKPRNSREMLESSEKSATEKLYDLLSSSKQVALMENGGLFIPGQFGNVRADAVDVHTPALLLVDDKVSQPVTQVNQLAKKILAKLDKVRDMNYSQLKKNLSKKTFNEIFDEAKREKGGIIYVYNRIIACVEDKIKTRGAKEYKKLYAKLAAGATTLSKEALVEVKAHIESLPLMLGQYRK